MTETKDYYIRFKNRPKTKQLLKFKIIFKSDYLIIIYGNKVELSNPLYDKEIEILNNRNLMILNYNHNSDLIVEATIHEIPNHNNEILIVPKRNI